MLHVLILTEVTGRDMETEQTRKLEQGALDILSTLRGNGFEAYWAGGCVRDRLLGRLPQDVDIVTSARPDQIPPLFPKTVAIGKAFGVIGVVHDETLYEVATFRTEQGFSDGRRPDTVEFTDAQQDARRRDFTINALFYDPIEQRVLDYVDGQKDIAQRCVRTVGNPDARFGEDHLRMLRAVRFATVLDFTLEPGTQNAIVKQAGSISRISPERIRDELVRIFTESVRPGDALQLLHETRVLDVVLPEVAAMDGVAQPPEFHPEGNVFEHTRLMLNQMRRRSPVLAFAVLLHDVGKPPTAQWGPGGDGNERIRFDGHDKEGAVLAESILKRLRFPTTVIRDVAHCVRNHMRFMHVQEMRRAKLRALVAAPTFEVELELHRLDCLSSHRELSHYHFIKEFAQTVEDEPSLPRAWIRGEDLMELGVSEGPAIGRWLETAYTRQLERDFENRDDLLAWLREAISQNRCRH